MAPTSSVEPQEICQSPQLTPALPQEITPQDFFRRGAILYRDRQALTQENFQFPTQSIRVFQRGCTIRRDQEEGFQGLFVQVRRFGFDHFNSHDAERPHVNFGAVFALLDHFGGHPVGRADHGGTFRFSFGEFGAEAEVGCMECEWCIEEQGKIEEDSLILTLPRASRRTLSLLMSRWMMFWLCRCARPLHVWTAISACPKKGRGRVLHTSLQMVDI